MKLVAYAAIIAGVLYLILSTIAIKDLYGTSGTVYASNIFMGIWVILVAVILCVLVLRS